MKKSKNLDRALIVIVVLLSFGVVYYVGIETGKRISGGKVKEEKAEIKETYTPPATSVEFKVYGELVEEEPPPVTTPSPVTAPSIVSAPEAPAQSPPPVEKKEIQPQKKEKKEVVRIPVERKTPIYTIQVASFKKRDDAQKLVAMLKKKGYPVYMVPAMVGGVVHYRVRVGEFKSASEAQKLKEKIERVEKLKAFITLKEK
jgi:cell division protein FtsN